MRKWPCRSLCGDGGERADEAAFGELYFERVVALRLCVAERGIGRGAEGGLVCGLSFERVLGFRRAPGTRADATERDARFANAAGLYLHNKGGGGERELIGGAVAELEVMRSRAGGERRKRDVCDEVAGLQHVFEIRRTGRQEVEGADGHFALALLAEDVDAGF